jgi:hypothetical protein
MAPGRLHTRRSKSRHLVAPDGQLPWWMLPRCRRPVAGVLLVLILTLLLASTAATSTATCELSSLSEPEGGIALLQRLAMLFGQM